MNGQIMQFDQQLNGLCPPYYPKYYLAILLWYTPVFACRPYDAVNDKRQGARQYKKEINPSASEINCLASK
jgi:hypothetical protein